MGASKVSNDRKPKACSGEELHTGCVTRGREGPWCGERRWSRLASHGPVMKFLLSGKREGLPTGEGAVLIFQNLMCF